MQNGTEEPKKSKRFSWKQSMQLMAYMRPYRGRFAVGMVFLFLSSVTTMLFPGMAGKLVDVEETELPFDPGILNLETMDAVAIALMIVFICQAIFSFFRIYIFSDVTERVLRQLRQETFSHLIQLPMDYFNRNRVGELNSRLSSDITTLQETFTTTVAEFFRQILTITIGIILLSIYSLKLTLLMLGIVPVMTLGAVFFGKYVRKLSKQTQQSIADSNTLVEEVLSGIKNVKSFVNEQFELNRYRKITDEVRDVAMKGAVWRAGFSSFIIFGLFGAIVVVIWYGARLKAAGEISSGDLFSFVLYSVFVGSSIGGIANIFSSLQKAIGATEDLFAMQQHPTETLSDSSTVHDLLKQELAFENVSFEYATRAEVPVLKEVSFSIEKGKTLALVGQSGSGKSTIVSLVQRFYDPTKGTIKFDGKDTREFPLSDLRNQMALVPQEVLLFGGTIAENIAYGKPNGTIDEIKAAAEMANATEFINKFPDGLDTVVGERGIQLSGGQRQRIAIARAVIKDPCILILDEATSSLDSQAEQLVQEAIEKVMKQRTAIVIAHRLSTIKNADKIIVLQDGELIEEGDHNSLIAKDGKYNELHHAQELV